MKDVLNWRKYLKHYKMFLYNTAADIISKYCLNLPGEPQVLYSDLATFSKKRVG